MVRLQPAALGQLDAWLDAQAKPRPTRPEAIRTLLQEALAAKGPPTPAEAQAALTDQIHALEAKVASIPEAAEPSPEAGMNTMKKALAEAELVGLKTRRKRLRKPSRREGQDGAR